MLVGKVEVKMSRDDELGTVVRLKVKNEIIDGLTYNYYTVTDDGLELRLKWTTLKGIVRYIRSLMKGQS